MSNENEVEPSEGEREEPSNDVEYAVIRLEHALQPLEGRGLVSVDRDYLRSLLAHYHASAAQKRYPITAHIALSQRVTELEAQLAAAKAEIAAWEASSESLQDVATARVDRAEKALADAKAENERLKAELDLMTKARDAYISEDVRLTAEAERLRGLLEDNRRKLIDGATACVPGPCDDRDTWFALGWDACRREMLTRLIALDASTEEGSAIAASAGGQGKAGT